MAKRCDLTGIGAQVGNNVSHSHRKTRRRFMPNLQKNSLASVLLNKKFSLNITSATLRSVDHNGGLDRFLLTTASTKLTPLAQKIKRQLKKIVAAEEKPAQTSAK